MAQNNLPDDKDGLFTQAEDMADGLHAHEAAIGVKHNTEPAIRTALAEARAAEDDYQAKLAGMKPLRIAVTVATSNGRAWATLTRDIWKPVLGARFNAAWKPAGFEGSIAIPGKAEEVQSLLLSMKSFLEKNPGHALPPKDITPERADALATALSDARSALNDQDNKATAAHDVRDAKMDFLRKKLRACIAEVGQLLGPLDPRWIALGLNRPGDPDRPDPPENLRLEPAGPGKLRAVCDPAPRAEHYRWYKKLEGIDADFTPAGATQDPQTILENLPAGATVEAHVVAGNQGGDSAASEHATAKVV